MNGPRHGEGRTRGGTRPPIRRRVHGVRFGLIAAVTLAGSFVMTASPSGALPGDVGVEGGAFVEVVIPTQSKPESKVWFQDGRWFSIQVGQTGVDSQGRPTGDQFLTRLEVDGTWTKLIDFDDRATTKADVLVDGNKLLVSLHKTDRNTGETETKASNFTRLHRFTYRPATHDYAVAGAFSVMNPYEMEALTIDRASDGTLWAAWAMGDGTPDPLPPAAPLARSVWTQYSTNGGTTWSVAEKLPGAAGALTYDDIAAVVAFGDKVGVMWDSGQPVADDGFSFVTHAAAGGAGGWSDTEAVFRGANVGDDHINLKAIGDRVFAAVKTSNDTGSTPLIVLLQRSSTGAWTRRTAWVGSDNVTRPVVQLNAETKVATVYATGPQMAGAHGEDGGYIRSKEVPFDSGQFPAGTGTTRMGRDGSHINNVSGSKAPVTNETGQVMLAADSTTMRYWHSQILGVPPKPPIPAGATVYTPITPCRILDTRVGGGGRVGPDETRGYVVTGSGSQFATQGGKSGGCGIPDGAAAVQASVTATAPSGTGFLRVWPADEASPGATFLNFTGGQATTNTGSVTLAKAGSSDLKLKGFGSASDYVIDVQGYYRIAPAVGSVYVALQPCRVVDTRVGGGQPIAANESRNLRIAGSGPEFVAQGGKANGCGIPDGAAAVEASVTAVSPEGTGYFRAWPNGEGLPSATFLNFTKHQGTTNTGALKLAPTGALDLSVRNFGGSSDYVIDVQGYYVPEAAVPAGSNGAYYVPVSPCRVLDTRSGGGGLLVNETSRDYRVAGSGGEFTQQGGKSNGCGLPDGSPAAAVSVTAVAPTGNGFTRAWPKGSPAPTATMLNFTKAQSTTNSGAVTLAATGALDLSLKNFGGPSQYVIDVQGYFTAVPPA